MLNSFFLYFIFLCCIAPVATFTFFSVNVPQCVTVSITDDDLYEKEDNFEVHMSVLEGAAIIKDPGNYVTVCIQDDDSKKPFS